MKVSRTVGVQPGFLLGKGLDFRTKMFLGEKRVQQSGTEENRSEEQRSAAGDRRGVGPAANQFLRFLVEKLPFDNIYRDLTLLQLLERI